MRTQDARAAREDAGLSLDELSEATKRAGYRVPPQTISRAERNGVPKYDTVIAIENALGVEPGSLVFPGVPVRRKRVRR